MHIITTDRLTLRSIGTAHAAALHALWTHPDVRRYLWDNETIPYEQTIAILEQNARQFRDEGHGLWGAFPPGTDTLLGVTGYWYFYEPPQLQLLYALAPNYWSRGYATEIAGAMLRYGFETLNFDAVIGCTDAPNTASKRVMERLGMTLWKTEVHHGLEQVFYRLEAAAFVPQPGAYQVQFMGRRKGRSSLA